MSYTPTIVTFTQSCHTLTSQVQLVQSSSDKLYVVTHSTPFHPVSHIWPDHPADQGTLHSAHGTFAVVDCQVGAIELATGHLSVGPAIPVKRDAPGWVFVVVHVLEAEVNAVALGETVTLTVNAAYQQRLSRGHSAGHLAYLALNKVLAKGYWRKDADRKDPHGHCDFNSYAQVTSFVTEDRCVDTYRLGKTLRKRGLNSDDMLNDLASIENQVNQQLVDWLALRSPMMVSRDGDALTDSRYWECDLHEGAIARIPCGGTHATSLCDYQSIVVNLQIRDDQHIEMHTHVTPASEE
ncbi:alanyl-tRNA editing protein [Vibrio furnissii]|uniref:alanyl-tRNA editing protein n=1 Tax=Vibrio furnissii TaxID=29494 RepID=UPI001E3BA911|nr:alanyl-tRNA editing protein [Vibrio furnissii]UHJ60899.1 alanyl-tRNA editing protein [Vibrio furnissii]